MLGRLSKWLARLVGRGPAHESEGVPDEWILSLDGKDLAILTDREQVEQFWCAFRVEPLAPENVALLTDTKLWDGCRFRYRHKTSGRVAAHAFGWPPKADDMRAFMRGLY